jgi:thiamine pyrophosphate-dependent acetolactate synthase large subunit-like protein
MVGLKTPNQHCDVQVPWVGGFRQRWAPPQRVGDSPTLWHRYLTLIDNNHSLNQDKARVDRAYGGVATGNREEIWVFRNVDVSHITPSMGCFGVRVERPGDIQNALEQASASGKPAVVDIASDINAFAPLPHVPD